jgi:UTP--glucose-1-phosphate uridylyltransferase
VWCAREIIGSDPFALLLPDVLVQAKKSCLAQMIDVYAALGENANLIAVEEVPEDLTHMYGVVGMGSRKGKAFEITGMIEKPARGKAPSNRIITGRYILQPEIFEFLEKQERGAGGEIQLTDAMLALAKKQPFYGVDFEGRTFDCGSKIGFLSANVAYALAREDLAAGFRTELQSLLARK